MCHHKTYRDSQVCNKTDLLDSTIAIKLFYKPLSLQECITSPLLPTPWCNCNARFFMNAHSSRQMTFESLYHIFGDTSHGWDPDDTQLSCHSTVVVARWIKKLVIAAKAVYHVRVTYAIKYSKHCTGQFFHLMPNGLELYGTLWLKKVELIILQDVVFYKCHGINISFKTSFHHVP